MPCGSGSFSGQELCERTTSAMALIGGFRRETLISSSKTSPDFSGCWQHMKAPPALISFVVPLMSVRWVSAKTGNVRLALGCCRLSVTLAVHKIIPSSIQSHSLDLVVGQVILPFTQQEGYYLSDSSPLAISYRKEKP